MLQSLKVLILAFPELIKIVHSIVAMIKEAEDKKALSQATKDINEAFKNGDTTKLNDVFHKLRK
jgi:hypothetical protein